jgi:hypothetical protein
MRSWPVVDDVASSRNLERQDREPTDGVLPSTGKTPRWVDEATNIHGERSVDGVHHSKFGECLHHQVHHDTDNGKSNNNRGRSARDEGICGTNEQTGTNSTATAKNVRISKILVIEVCLGLTWQSSAYGGLSSYA